MTDDEISARGQRAQTYRDEFLEPILGGLKKEYTDRIAEIAAKELNPKRREQAITSLSVALRILGTINTELTACAEAGKIAEKSILRAREVERMSKPARRLLDFVPH